MGLSLVLPKFHTVDDVLEGVAVSVELVLRGDTDKIIHLPIRRHCCDDPIGFTSSRRRLIRCFGKIACPAADANSFVASRDAHVCIRASQFVQQLIRCFLQRNPSLAVIIRFESLDHHPVRRGAVDDASVRRDRHRASLTVLMPVIRIWKLNVLAVVGRHAAGRHLRPSCTVIRRTGTRACVYPASRRGHPC